MRQRRNHFQRLTGLAGLLLRRQEAHGAHVVQPVGHLDHQHTRVTRHRDDHLADGFAFGGVTQHHLVELGDAVNEVSYLGAEFGGQLLQAISGVLHGVMQDRRHQRGGIHTQLGQDVGHRDRVGDVGVPRLAELLGMPAFRYLVCPLQHRPVGFGVELAVNSDERFQDRADRAALGCHPPRQPRPHPARSAHGAAAHPQRLGYRAGLTQRRQGFDRDLILAGHVLVSHGSPPTAIDYLSDRAQRS
ncbi:Uncharacterised protein [Mycobacteroides abscessus]|nr:Uncharacterised protein [Mycobacteroides abscessus]